jgi:hypothetical protein
MWETSQERATYTHYTSLGASRIDRIYGSRNLSRQKRSAETRVAAFTDHLAVVKRIALEDTAMRHGPSYWTLNAALLREKRFQEQLRQSWAEWSKQTKNYPTMVMWWERGQKCTTRNSSSVKGLCSDEKNNKWNISITPVFMSYCSDRSNTRKEGSALSP